ncbi:hypothetical protein [Aureispira anguillae]|nr:hypothetical protein [Aureispira anguillae]BDS13086.1 hypothetical protein AsAng_0038140 [Aureispira anguillae]
MKVSKQTFRQYCESTLTTQEFNNLYELANELPNVKKYNITRALNVPSRIPFELLRAIAPIVGKTLKELVLEYDCSIDVMSVRQFLKLRKEGEKANTEL